MIIIKNKTELNDILNIDKDAGSSIGFVPTMGALHQGHLTLLQQAIDENDKCVCSIFVNPTQFNNPEDLKNYPHDLIRDSKMLESIGCDYLFVPDVAEMYPKNEDKIIFDFGELEKVMEGADRPGHFQGVATIVKKLLEIIDPDKAYFGKKDYQQLMIIKSLKEQYRLKTEIIACDIVREIDGLAMSSRNQRLNALQRTQAPIIYRTLKNTQDLCSKLTVDELKDYVKTEINSNDMMDLVYFEITNPDTLLPIIKWNGANSFMGFIVVNMGDIRLIDNISLVRN